jgi:phospholipase/carboxylesterase
MENPHLAHPVLQEGARLTATNPVVLALHGHAQSPTTLLDLLKRLAWQEATIIAPAAHNGTWYPAPFMEPLAQNEPSLTYALRALAKRLYDLATQGVTPDRLYLIGFAEGASLLAQYLLAHPAPYAGVALYSGGVMGASDSQWRPSGLLLNVPMLITTHANDAQVPLARVQETTTLFRTMGADVTEKIYSRDDALVSADEITLTRQLFIKTP